MAAVTLKQLKQELKQALVQQTKAIFKEVSKHIDKAILPQIDKLSKRVSKIESNMVTKSDIGRIERKLVKIDDSLDRYGGRIDNHETRITRLETKTSIPS